MAHRLNMKNGKASMMYVIDVPWHGLGTKLNSLATSSEAIEAAQLNYSVVKAPAYASYENKYIPVADTFHTLRTDTNQVLGTVGRVYEIVQNKEAFEFFDGIVGGKEAMFETAGALGNGESVWMLAKLPSYINVGNKDDVGKYLLLSNSHDGTTRIRVKFTPIRVVCNNTLSIALVECVDTEVSIKHSTSAKTKFEEAQKVLQISHKVFDELEVIFKQMSLKKFSEKQLLDYVNKLVPDKENGETTTRSTNIRNSILELTETGHGSKLVTANGTLWGAYNAVTEYVDHIRGAEKDSNDRLNSIWFGSGSSLKEKAFSLAESIVNNTN